jgi:hypothetical protein
VFELNELAARDVAQLLEIGLERSERNLFCLLLKLETVESRRNSTRASWPKLAKCFWAAFWDGDWL